MIIDTHAHLGYDQSFDEAFPVEDLLEAQEQNNIDCTLVQPGTAHDLETVMKYHDAIAELTEKYPGRFRGIANPNPHLPAEKYMLELTRCIKDLNFVAVKLHPTAHAANPLGRDGSHVFACAAELEIPVMIHTGNGIPWAAPSLLEPHAQKYPQMKIILAHAGGMILAGEAGLMAQKYKNVYLECSWTAGFLVRNWTQQLGPERIMFGSDHGENAATELTKFRTAGLTDDELKWCLGRTAMKVFDL